MATPEGSLTRTERSELNDWKELNQHPSAGSGRRPITTTQLNLIFL